MSREPGLRFWLRWAEREGAIAEGDGAATLVLLPRHLQAGLGAPEAVSVTTDPEVAREEGALLMIPGHPALDAAVERVLTEGDAGVVRLEWPAKPPPSRDAVLETVRDQVGVDHGRLDAAGEPLPRYAPVLRVGVQVTYLVNDQFHEPEEAWIDARSGLALPAALVESLLRASPLAGRPQHAALGADLPAAVGAAHTILRERAGARRQALAKQGEGSLRDELAQAEAFYEAALDSIAKRRQAVTPERQALLDAQAEATRAERGRRLHEIREKFEPRHQIRPIRLHLVLAPALQVPLAVRRGPRGFPLEVTWWLATAGVGRIRCPACGSPAQLVAGKDRLGCRECLARPAVAAAVPGPAQAETVSDAAGLKPSATPSPATSAERALPEPVGRHGQPGPEPGAGERRGPAGRKQPRSREEPTGAATAAELARLAGRHRDDIQLRARVLRAGNKLGHDFWQAILNGESWPRKRAAADSPLRVLYRLYGAEGPLRGLGVEPGAGPLKSTTVTLEPRRGVLNCTSGELVTTGGGWHPYSLRWRFEGGKPAVDEVVPVVQAEWGELREIGAFGRSRRLLWAAPPPRIQLDPVAESLWRVELPRSGLPLVVRCLTAWWRIQDDPLLPEVPVPALSAAIAAALCGRAGLRRTRNEAATDHGARPADVVEAGHRLRPLLELSEVRWW